MPEFYAIINSDTRHSTNPKHKKHEINYNKAHNKYLKNIQSKNIVCLQKSKHKVTADFCWKQCKQQGIGATLLKYRKKNTDHLEFYT